MDDSDVILLNFWFSVFGVRARIALAEKGIHHEYREENIDKKSPLLLEMNPVHKTIPVLIHNGKPICESSIIVEYIQEAWHDKSPPLLPSDPYLRAQTRFWAHFLDNKCMHVRGRRIWLTQGQDQQVAKKEFMEVLNVLEGQLGENPYLVGNSFGLADIALIPFSSWFYTLNKIGNMDIEKECPKLAAWVNRCMERESVSKTLPDPHKFYDLVLEHNKKGH